MGRSLSPQGPLTSPKGDIALRRKLTGAIAGLALAAGSVIGLTLTAPTAVAAAPSTPPAQICGNSAILDGPSTPPAGAVVVPAGDNSSMTWAEGTTYWFESGVHTLGGGEFNQIIPKSNSRFVGAPGAILDGQGVNRYAINNRNATGVTVEHLEMRNFVPPHQTALVNNGAGKGWTIQRNYIHDNRYGTAVNFGSDGVVRENCLTKNGQYGWKAYHPNNLKNLILDRNEISYNNTERYDISKPGCGCSGAGKFWHASGVDVTDNWVHHNYGPGIWADTNDNDFLIQGNYVNDNNGKGIWYEISYNALIKGNTLIRNGLVEGPSNPSFPTGAIYIAESGGDSRVPARYSTIEITGNQMTDNWSGVVLWENANRFCGSNPTKHCTLVNPGVVTYEACSDPAIRANEPYYSDCRWKTQNVSVHGNTLTHDPANIPDCAAYDSCGMAGSLFSNWGNKEPWTGHVIKDAITFQQNNKFDWNSYAGPVSFLAYQMGRILTPSKWQASPYYQDVNSTFDGTVTEPPTTDEPPASGTVIEHATFETDLDNHKNWYNANLTRDGSGALCGTHSLRIESAAEKNVGVILDNWPGHGGIVAGTEYDISLLYREAAGTMPEATWTVTFRDSGGTVLQTHTIPMPRSVTRDAAGFRAVAPVGASVIHWTFTYPASPIGTALLVDDIKVQAVSTETVEQMEQPFIAYTPDSFFRKPLNGWVPVDDESATGIAFANSSNIYDHPRIRGVGGNKWGEPYAMSDCSDPLWKATGTLPSPLEFLKTEGFHAPANFGDELTGTSDSPATIIDTCGVPYMPNGMTVWLFKAAKDTGYTINVAGGGAYQHDSNGLDQRNPASNSTKNFTQNRGNILGSEVIRDDLLAYGEANNTDLGHVLEMFWTETDSAAGYVHPMVNYEKNKYGWGPEGIRIRVKSWIDLDARPGCTGPGKVIAKTLQNYGAVLGDNSGSDAGIKAEQDSTYPGLTIDVLEGCITWDDMQFVKRGWEGP